MAKRLMGIVVLGCPSVIKGKLFFMAFHSFITIAVVET